jgi:hypothetical protein
VVAVPVIGVVDANEEFSALKAHFMCNVDETGEMANLGSIKVM